MAFLPIPWAGWRAIHEVPGRVSPEAGPGCNRQTPAQGLRRPNLPHPGARAPVHNPEQILARLNAQQKAAHLSAAKGVSLLKLRTRWARFCTGRCAALVNRASAAAQLAGCLISLARAGMGDRRRQAPRRPAQANSGIPLSGSLAASPDQAITPRAQARAAANGGLLRVSSIWHWMTRRICPGPRSAPPKAAPPSPPAWRIRPALPPRPGHRRPWGEPRSGHRMAMGSNPMARGSACRSRRLSTAQREWAGGLVHPTSAARNAGLMAWRDRFRRS